MQKKRIPKRKQSIAKNLIFPLAGAAAISACTVFLFELALDPNSDFFMGKLMKKGNAADKRNAGAFLPPEHEREYRRESRRWLDAAAGEEYLESEDGLRLRALSVHGNSDSWVVLCHGYGGNAESMAHAARRMYERGYSVLLPDARSHGKSQGRYVGMGWTERRDIVLWCRQIAREHPTAKILLFGVSMGAATVMMASGEADLPRQVCGVIEDCGYTSVWEEFAAQLGQLFKLPTFPLLNDADALCMLLAGYEFREASARKQVAKCRQPMLFIHGDRDLFVPFAMRDALYNVAGGPKERLTVCGAAHAQSSLVDPDTYWAAVDAFLRRYHLTAKPSEKTSGRNEETKQGLESH